MSCASSSYSYVLLSFTKSRLRVPELNILSLTLVSSPEQAIDTPEPSALAILHLDHRQNIQLLLRDLNISEYELSPSPSLMFTPATISSKVFEMAPVPENPPIIVNIPPLQLPNPEAMEGTSDFNGGLLVIGGKKLLLFELTSKEFQRKHHKKLRKQESRRSTSGKDKAKAEPKEEKEGKSRSKPIASVAWPWSEVTAYAILSFLEPSVTETLTPSDRCCQANDEGTRYLVGDAYGRLAMLSLDSLYDQGLILIPLGEVHPKPP